MYRVAWLFQYPPASDPPPAAGSEIFTAVSRAWVTEVVNPAPGVGRRADVESAGRDVVRVDVTELVRKWLAHPEENLGILLRGRAGGGGQYTLRSSEHPDQQYRPKKVFLPLVLRSPK